MVLIGSLQSCWPVVGTGIPLVRFSPVRHRTNSHPSRRFFRCSTRPCSYQWSVISAAHHHTTSSWIIRSRPYKSSLVSSKHRFKTAITFNSPTLVLRQDGFFCNKQPPPLSKLVEGSDFPRHRLVLAGRENYIYVNHHCHCPLKSYQKN